MRIAFFHGLESKPRSEKNIFLEEVFDHIYAPEMDYNLPDIFDKTLKDIQDFNPDLLIGSSMGGYFAFCLSTLTNIPTLIFNPAVIDRIIEPRVTMGEYMPEQTIILGKNDNIIGPYKSAAWFDQLPKKSFNFHWEEIGHRIPLPIFEKWILKKYSDFYKKKDLI